MARTTNVANWILKLPVLWGGLATLAFYVVIGLPVLKNETLQRYFNGHIVEQIATLLFFVAIASLAIRLMGLLGQFMVVGRSLIDEPPAEGYAVSETWSLLEKLKQAPSLLKNSYYYQRIEAALQYVQQTDSADAIEEQLDRLEYADHQRVNNGYALPRLVRAILPVIGLLGTVIGITLAIGQLSPDQLEQSLTSVMTALSVAFDTTAQAMTLMLVLWGAMHLVEQVEYQLLDRVNQKVAQDLVGLFERLGTSTDPNVASIRRMNQQVVEAVDQLCSRQADSWKVVIDATQKRWQQATDTATNSLADSIGIALGKSLDSHSQNLQKGVEVQIRRLADSVNTQTNLTGETVRKQLDALSKIESDYLARIENASREQADKLSTGTEGLLNNLRDGLERMAELLVEGLQRHGETLTQAEESLASENRKHLTEVEAALGESMVIAADRQEKLIAQSENLLNQVQSSMDKTAETSVEQQQQLIKHGEVLLRVVETTNQVQQLEETLSRNLETLGKTHNLEETLLSLSAAIQLLSARVGVESPTRSLGNKAA